MMKYNQYFKALSMKMTSFILSNCAWYEYTSSCSITSSAFSMIDPVKLSTFAHVWVSIVRRSSTTSSQRSIIDLFIISSFTSSYLSRLTHSMVIVAGRGLSLSNIFTSSGSLFSKSAKTSSLLLIIAIISPGAIASKSFWNSITQSEFWL